MTADFGAPWKGMTWTTQPRHVAVSPKGHLIAQSAGKTDFWQKTYYGFERDNGHALLAQRTGDFSATLSVFGNYQELYDQAGLMLRFSPTAWIKFGIEYTDGLTHLSVVVTDGTSDWSANPISLNGAICLRATRLRRAVLLEHRLNDGRWQMARLAPISDAQIGVGPYLCSPERAGFEAEFRDFLINEPQVHALHAQA